MQIAKTMTKSFALSPSYCVRSSIMRISLEMYGLPMDWNTVIPIQNQMLRAAIEPQRYPQNLKHCFQAATAIVNEFLLIIALIITNGNKQIDLFA